MYRTRIAAVVGWVLAGSAAAFAQAPPVAPMLQHIPASRMLGLAVVSGRIVNTHSWQFGGHTSSSTDGTSREEMSFNGNGNTGSVRYQRTSPAEDFSLEINSEGRFHFLRREKENAGAASVEFVQEPGEPVTLSVGPADHRQVHRAPTFWHLAIIQREACRQHVYPLLDALRPRWQVARTADLVESQLLKLAADDNKHERQQWAGLVEQLADDRFAKREAADRQLRAGGTAAIAYLRQLDFTRLDPEQQSRVRRILRSVVPERTDDSPEQAAALLVDDPSIWLTLLARPDVSIRRTAARRLAILLDEPVKVDPTADPASQKGAMDALRTKVERKVEGGRRKAE